MMNAAGDVLYVGKAKSLKKRVSSYARGGVHSDRLTRMVAETAEMLFVTTASETDALLLESNLIKRLKPRYNVSYRDDKSFPNILLREESRFSAALEASRRQDHQGHLFRPLRQRRRRQPHPQHLAARLSAALLFGFGI
jgi:excinuclease ABC subunit C